MISINITVHADEVLFRLDQIPKKLREALRKKFEQIFVDLEEKLFIGTPNRYLDQKRLKTGVSDVGSAVVGFLEYEERQDKYPITPKTAAFLQFRGAKDNRWVRTHLVEHPYPKGAPAIAQLLRESKPWIFGELEDAVEEALRK